MFVTTSRTYDAAVWQLAVQTVFAGDTYAAEHHVSSDRGADAWDRLPVSGLHEEPCAGGLLHGCYAVESCSPG